jgi:hypothetical protein
VPVQRIRAGVAVFSALGVIVACGGEPPPVKAPPPPPPPNDPPLLARISEACVRVAGCTRAGDAARFRDPGACVDWWLADADARAPDPLRKCLTDATTCEAVTTCLRGGGDGRAAAFCAQRQGVVSGCDGDRLVSCADDDVHESAVVDCAAIGATCREVKAAGGIVLRACASPQKCPAGAPESRCDGAGAVVSCRDGAIERVVCRPGTTCEERKDESGEAIATCELPGRRRCELRGARHCEEDRLVECDRTSNVAKAKVTDCVGFGLRCGGIGPRAGCRVPSNVECDRELLPRCEGGALVFCAAGRLAKVACSSVGLGTCDPAGRGAIAACAPRAAPASAPAQPGHTAPPGK